jgi:hypothetical protein
MSKSLGTEGGNRTYAHGKPIVWEYARHQIEKVVIVFIQFDCLECNRSKYRSDPWRKFAFRFPILCQTRSCYAPNAFKYRSAHTFRDSNLELLNGSFEIGMERVLRQGSVRGEPSTKSKRAYKLYARCLLPVASSSRLGSPQKLSSCASHQPPPRLTKGQSRRPSCSVVALANGYYD